MCFENMPLFYRATPQNKNRRPYVHTRILGVSLTQLMVGLTLSAWALVLMCQGYAVVKKNYLDIKGKLLSINQQETVYAYFIQDVLASGYRGCRTSDPHYPLYQPLLERHPVHRYHRFDKALFAFHAKNSNCYGKLPDKICDRVKEGTDVLVLYNVPRNQAVLSAGMQRPGEELKMQSKVKFNRDSLVLISDCERAEVFLPDAVRQNLVAHPPLTKLYDKNTESAELEVIVYFVGLPERYLRRHPNKTNFSPYGLFRGNIIHPVAEILPNIKEFKVNLRVFSPQSNQIYYIEAKRYQDEIILDVELSLTLGNNEVWTYEMAPRNRYGNVSGDDPARGILMSLPITFSRAILGR